MSYQHNPYQPGAPPSPQPPQYQPQQPYQQQAYDPYQQAYGQHPQQPGPSSPYAQPAGQPAAYNQPYSPQRQQQYVPAAGSPYQAAPAVGFVPSQPPQPAQGGGAGFSGAPGGFMSNLTSPLGFMAAGSLLSGPQNYMQQQMGWLKSNVTTGTMSALFNIDNAYVATKLMMLLTPFLGKWGWVRQLEQMSGGQKYRPPREDPNAPDLYLPVMAAWTYVLLACVMAAGQGKFTPEVLSTRIYGAAIAWGLHWAVARLLLKGMSVSSVPWSELLAHTGYSFFPVCLAIIAGGLAGRIAYYVVWVYGSLSMGVFMVKCFKRVVQQERHYGHDIKMTNYLLLGLAAFQFPFGFWLGIRPAK